MSVLRLLLRIDHLAPDTHLQQHRFLRGKTVDKHKYDQWKDQHKADVEDEELETKHTSFHRASLHVIEDDSPLRDSPRFTGRKECDKRLIDDT